ncbi:hypothetical protein PPERSA_01621 [Pseudocohnilembus persalinus]|uniref:Tubulin-tyrosine ligase family protein n=1 Tax=Pseudocohnilembus persalinus TaxID=266149 RepID=A0A0V0QHN1_PSEPJ|nr:hypothetical protein PPERSA_01621 [Pseudocohnilembus persalinus]|eukprot:KRX01751.1 hypothetical protein PPERSA_01621 [Pseudocohnilembus persalinus]
MGPNSQVDCYKKLNNQTQNTLTSLSNLDETKLDSSFKRTPVKKSYNNFLDTNQEMEQSATIKQMKSKIHSEMLKASKIAPQRSGQVKKRVLYKCFIQGTNNTQLVKNIIQKKQGWGIVGNQEGFNHLLWFDSAQKIRFEMQGVQQQQLQLQQQNQQKDSKKKQMVNHFQGYKELASKPLLLRNFEKICKQYKLQMFDFTPLSFIIDGNSNSYQNDFEDFLNIFYSKSVAEKQDLINIEILRRKHFYKQSLQESQQSYKYNNKNNNNNVLQENQEVSQINKLKGAAQLRNHDTMHQGKNMWIFKPSDNNRGIGIRIFSTIQELILILQEFYNIQQICDEDDESTDSHSNSNSSQYNNNNNKSNYIHNCAYNNLSSRPVTAQQQNSRTVSQFKGKGFLQKQKQQQINNNFVIQKYIEKPLLINERKFDLRIWVLIAPDMQLYVFKEGYLRLSGEKYNIQQNYSNNNSNKNQVMHLTNNAIQKHAKSYGKYEEGNQMNYDQFEDYLEKKQIDLKFRKKILPKMKEIVALTYSSVKEKLNPNKYENCFEIFGYDFFIDADYQVWLIEANTNPCLEESSQIQKELLPRMLNDAFKICLDKNFPCNFQQKDVYQDPTKKNFTVKGYDDAENLWEPCSIKKFNQIKICQ